MVFNWSYRMKRLRDTLVTAFKTVDDYKDRVYYGLGRTDDLFPYVILRLLDARPVEIYLRGQMLQQWAIRFAAIIRVQNTGDSEADEDAIIDAAGGVITVIKNYSENLAGTDPYEGWEEATIENVELEWSPLTGTFAIGEARVFFEIRTSRLFDVVS